MGKFFSDLIARDETTVDSLVFAGLVVTAVFIGLAAYDLIALHNAFNPLTFSTSAGAILASGAGSRRLRGDAPKPPGQP